MHLRLVLTGRRMQKLAARSGKLGLGAHLCSALAASSRQLYSMQLCLWHASNHASCASSLCVACALPSPALAQLLGEELHLQAQPTCMASILLLATL